MADASQEPDVALVIPCRNAAGTLEACLSAVCPQRGRDRLREILVVDDGSSDATAQLAERFAVRVVEGEGLGAAAARNVGWRASAAPLVWFLDADCVAEPEALGRLLAHLGDPQVAAAGGSYSNLRPESLLACWIHEEIIERHLRMPAEVNVLGSYHVVYRRRVLEELGGFDPDCMWAHDAELAFRVAKAGYRLRFESRSRVGHFHASRLGPYLARQWQQGYWRVMLYRRHPRQMAGDSYSGLLDYVQPPLAMLFLAALPLALWQPLAWVPLMAGGGLVAAQLPMTLRVVRRTRRPAHTGLALMGITRAFWRGFGMLRAVWDWGSEALVRRHRRPAGRATTPHAPAARQQNQQSSPAAKYHHEGHEEHEAIRERNA